MAKPKLALIPAAQGSKFYSVLPSDGTGDFTFGRSSAATRINKYGYIETVASSESRLNYPLIDGIVTGCPHHILEPARTNLVTYSQDFSQTYWTKIGSSISSNVTISPDGTQNASKLVEDNLVGEKRLRVNAVSTSGYNTLSFFVKKAERKWVMLREAGSTAAYAYFDLENGVIGQSNLAENIEIKKFPNGWYRISFKDSLTSVAIEIRLALSDGVTNYQGDGASGVYIWGAQTEQSDYPTSYIVSNSGSTTTRVAETATGAGDASTFNDSEGVLMIEASALADDLTERRFGITNGSSDAVRIGYTNVSNRIVGIVFNGANQAILTYDGGDITTNNKIALKYKVNDFALWVNGYKVSIDTSGTTFLDGTLTDLRFNIAGSNNFYGKAKQVQYYSILTDSELETLTSWVSFQDMAEGQLYTIE